MTALPDRCERCLCEDCGGTLAHHIPQGCGCPGCMNSTGWACTEFLPPRRIAIIVEQLSVLMSVHLGTKHYRRCQVAAHAAHHAILDHDYPEQT